MFYWVVKLLNLLQTNVILLFFTLLDPLLAQVLVLVSDRRSFFYWLDLTVHWRVFADVGSIGTVALTLVQLFASRRFERRVQVASELNLFEEFDWVQCLQLFLPRGGWLACCLHHGSLDLGFAGATRSVTLLDQLLLQSIEAAFFSYFLHGERDVLFLLSDGLVIRQVDLVMIGRVLGLDLY